MTLDPLLDTNIVIQIHVVAALAAIVFGAINLYRPKGTFAHRFIGYIWVTAMGVTAISSFWIHKLQMWGIWSWIHLLSIFTITCLIYGVYAARSGNIQGHKYTRMALYWMGLVLTGLFTLLPGRIMHTVIFG